MFQYISRYLLPVDVDNIVPLISGHNHRKDMFVFENM